MLLFIFIVIVIVIVVGVFVIIIIIRGTFILHQLYYFICVFFPHFKISFFI